MGKLTAAVCECGQVFLPPKERCVSCSGFTESLEIGDKGKILSYTVLHVTPEGFEPPLVLGVVEMDGTAGNEKLKPPKIVCVGSVLEDELEVGLKVRVLKLDNTYFFGL